MRENDGHRGQQSSSTNLQVQPTPEGKPNLPVLNPSPFSRASPLISPTRLRPRPPRHRLTPASRLSSRAFLPDDSGTPTRGATLPTRSNPAAASSADSGELRLSSCASSQGRLLPSTSSFLCMEHDGAIFPHPSHPAVHPAPATMGMEAAPDAAAVAAEQGGDANGNAPPPGVLMEDMLGAPGTHSALMTRLTQAILAAAAIAFMMSASDFDTVSAFRCLVVVAGIQCVWCLVLAGVDFYGLLAKRSFRTLRISTIFSIGDWVTGGLTLAAALGTAAITALIDIDMHRCSMNPCNNFRAAIAMALLSWLAIVPSCLFNLWAAFYRLQTRA